MCRLGGERGVRILEVRRVLVGLVWEVEGRGSWERRGRGLTFGFAGVAVGNEHGGEECRGVSHVDCIVEIVELDWLAHRRIEKERDLYTERVRGTGIRDEEGGGDQMASADMRNPHRGRTSPSSFSAVIRARILVHG